jgi:universal stress protein E
MPTAVNAYSPQADTRFDVCRTPGAGRKKSNDRQWSSRETTGIPAMTRTQRILVVADPAAATQPALARAARVAGAMGWGIELFACIHSGLPARIPKAMDGGEVRRRLLAHQLGFLDDLASHHPGLQIVTRAVWDRPLHEAIIRETLRVEPRLVMKDSHFHSTISRALVTNTDWHLVRDCPAPLWLVRGREWPGRPRLLAMVDPTHEHDQPAELDHRLLREASQLAKGLDGEVHAVHCHDPTPFVAVAGALGAPGATEEVARAGEASQAEQAAQLDALATQHGLPRERVHLRQGAPASAIPDAARGLQGDLAVMGAVSRSGVQRLFIGNTAERVLDQLPCDVLVIKPARFESPVTYRPQAADFMELS